MKAANLRRNYEDYDTEDGSSEDDLLPPETTTVPNMQSQKLPDPDEMSSSLNAPPDRYNAIYIIFFIQGIGMLLPWNFFITAKDYFEFKFQNDEAVKGKFENAFALSAMFPNLISLFLNVFLTSRLSRSARVIPCLTATLVTFIVTTVLVKVNTADYTDKFFAITICIIILTNMATGVYQGTLFGVAGIVGADYIQAIMSGQAIAGIFAALAGLISELVTDDSDPTNSALIYFLIAVFVIIVSGISYSILFKFPRMQFYLRRAQRHGAARNSQQTIQVEDTPAPPVPYLTIFKQLLPMALSVTCVFAVSLTVFPAIISSIESTDKDNNSKWTGSLFPLLVCFLLFNTGDWCGRLIAGQVQIVKEKGPWLPLLCLLRVVFVPLFLMCNTKNRYMPYVFKHDYWPVIINVFFSVSNGYLGSLCMMYGPKLVVVEHAETAGTIMSLFLIIGLTTGACISFAFS